MSSTRRAAAGATVLLLAGVGAAAPTAEASFAGRNGRVVVAQVTRHAGAPDTSDIYTSDIHGRNRVRLTWTGTATSPAWSRSGKRIAYVDQGAIMLMARSGRNKIRLDATGYNSSPTWAPGGRKVAFVSDRGQGAQVYVRDLRRGTIKQVTSKGGVNARASSPVWSPKDATIAFVRDTGGQSDLWTVHANGSGLTRVTKTTGVSEMSPDWAPDGRLLVYQRYDGYGDGCAPGGIYTVRLADGRTHKVVDTPCSDLHPRWSPDRRRIMWQVQDGPAGGRSRAAGIYTVRWNGSDRRGVLTGANRWFEPDWQSLR